MLREKVVDREGEGFQKTHIYIDHGKVAKKNFFNL